MKVQLSAGKAMLVANYIYRLDVNYAGSEVGVGACVWRLIMQEEERLGGRSMI